MQPEYNLFTDSVKKICIRFMDMVNLDWVDQLYKGSRQAWQPKKSWLNIENVQNVDRMGWIAVPTLMLAS